MSKNVINANIKIHSELIERGIYQKSIHKSLRNEKKLNEYFKKFSPKTVHLDTGCGDGFIFKCTKNQFVSYGIDITKAMLDECKKNHPNVNLIKSKAEKLPFESSFFNLITSYSFVDHLYNRKIYYQECFRVLKRNGSFFAGLIPNQNFYKTFEINKFIKQSFLQKTSLKNELTKAYQDGKYYSNKFKIDEKLLEACEPGKIKDNGINPVDEIKILKNIGFKNIQIEFDWIVAENKIKNREIINNIYLAQNICSSAFKYFNIYAKK